jgi:septum formation protein
MPKLILASSSPFRHELLARLRIPFQVVAPEVDETPADGETPEDLVERLAIEKAHAVVRLHRGAMVIGADQVAVHEGRMVGKPGTHARAVDQLRSASGRTITLYTGLALVNDAGGTVQSDVVPFAVKFRQLSDQQIERYLRKERPYGCSGSLRAEGLGIALLEHLHGDDPTALIGLPLIRLVAMLEQEGVEVI